MNRCQTRFWAACFVALTVLSATCEAKVFQRMGRIAASDAFEHAGGAIAYDAHVSINGGDGHLSVAGFSTDLRSVLTQLRNAFNTTDIPRSGTGIVQATLKQGDRVTRLMVFHLAGTTRTLAIAVEQSAEDYAASEAPPERHLQRGMPAYPASTPRFFIADDEAAMSLAVANSHANADQALAFFDTALERDGWQALLPLGPRARMQVYARAHETCCVFVGTPPSPGGQNVIAVLHKQQRMK